MRLSDIIETYISGDWGNDEPTEDASCPVSCIRGADIVPIYNSEYGNIPLRYISEKSLSNRALQEGDIVIEKSGGSPTQSTGRVVYISKELLDEKQDIVCSNFCAAFRIKPEWDAKYVYYYLQHIYNAGVFFNFEGKTSGLKNLIMDTAFKSITIKKIAFETQRSIATVLSTIESKMAANRAINHYLEAMAKQLYDYWFVQFDFPDENGKPYKSSGGKMVWNDKLKREMPEGWEGKFIKDIANTYSGGTPQSSNKEYYENGNIPWINSGELNNPIITKTLNFITSLGLENSSAKLYPINTILVAMYGATAGKVSLLTFEACSNQAICGVMPKEEHLINYTYCFLSSLYNHFMKLSTGSARDNISQDTVRNTLISIPSKDILHKFANVSDNLIKEVVLNQKELELLEQQRNELIPLLMTGQVCIKQLNNDLANG